MIHNCLQRNNIHTSFRRNIPETCFEVFNNYSGRKGCDDCWLKFKIMISINKILLLLGLTFFLFASCSKEEDDDKADSGNNQQSPNGEMTCKVDGTNWSATLAVVATLDESAGIATVTGSDGSSKQCQVTINGFAGTGTYDLGGTLTNPNMGRWTASASLTDTYTTTLGQGSGSVKVTEVTDTSIKGTFSFTAKNSNGEEVSLTEGEFDAQIQE